MQRQAAYITLLAAISVLLAFIGLPLVLGVTVDFFDASYQRQALDPPANAQIPGIVLGVAVFYLPPLYLAPLAIFLTGLVVVQDEMLRESLRLMISSMVALGCLMSIFMIYNLIYLNDPASGEVVRRLNSVAYTVYFVVGSLALALIGLASRYYRTLPASLAYMVIIGAALSLISAVFLLGDYPFVQHYNITVLTTFGTLLIPAAYWMLVTSRA